MTKIEQYNNLFRFNLNLCKFTISISTGGSKDATGHAYNHHRCLIRVSTDFVIFH